MTLYLQQIIYKMNGKGSILEEGDEYKVLSLEKETQSRETWSI